MSPMDRQPVVTTGWITGFAAALVTATVAFGVDLTQDQTAAIAGVVVFVAPVVSAYVARRWAYAPATVRALRSSPPPKPRSP